MVKGGKIQRQSLGEKAVKQGQKAVFELEVPKERFGYEEVYLRFVARS